MTDLRSPAAAAFEVGGGVVRWAATCTPVNTIAIRTVNCSGGLFLRLRAIALALRGPPTGRQFKDSARCRAGVLRTAATVTPHPILNAGSWKPCCRSRHPGMDHSRE